MAATEGDETDWSSDDEDLLEGIVPTSSDSIDSATPKDTANARPPEPAAAATKPPPRPRTPVSPTTAAAPAAPATHTSQALRPRTSAPPPARAYTSARAALFADRRRGSPAPAQASTATAEAILDGQRAEQDALSDSMLKLAGALKASSQRFSTTLEADKEALGRAGDGMHRTERGMEAAHGGMGALRRMTEGKGWWGRMLLYAWVYGLMLALVLLVFALPKLRF